MKKFKIIFIVLIVLGLSFLIYMKLGGKLLKEENSFIENQKAIEDNIFNDAYSYSFEDAKLIVDPYDVSPLTAVVIFNTKKEEEVTMTVKGMSPNADIKITYPKGRVHYIPVVGLYDGYENTVIIETSSNKKKVFKIKTAKAFINRKIDNPTNHNLMLTGKNTYPAIYDFNGNLRWYLDKRFGLLYKGSKDSFYITSNIYTNNKFIGIYKMNLLGKVFEFNTSDDIKADSFKDIKIGDYERSYDYDFSIASSFKEYKQKGKMVKTKEEKTKYNIFKASGINEKFMIKKTPLYIEVFTREDDYLILDKFFSSKSYKLKTGFNYISTEGLNGLYKVYLKRKDKLIRTGYTMKF